MSNRLGSNKVVNEPLGRQIVFAGRAIREAFEAALAEAGGSLATWVVLSALSDVGIVSQAMLASHVHLEARRSPTTSTASRRRGSCSAASIRKTAGCGGSS